MLFNTHKGRSFLSCGPAMLAEQVHPFAQRLDPQRLRIIEPHAYRNNALKRRFLLSLFPPLLSCHSLRTKADERAVMGSSSADIDTTSKRRITGMDA
jgi:hypothetical protein